MTLNFESDLEKGQDSVCWTPRPSCDCGAAILLASMNQRDKCLPLKGRFVWHLSSALSNGWPTALPGPL